MTRYTQFLFCAFLSAQIAVAGDSVYKSVDDAGVIVFSDAPLKQGSLQRQSYKNFKGRETATASCTGVNTDLLTQRFTQIENFVRVAAEQNQIDPLLVKAVARVESCFDTAAVSRAGASGAMQLMPKTAASLGVTQVFDPEQNILGGSRYLAKMLKRFEGDLNLALAGYNAGPGAVERFNGVPPFPETQNYIKRVNKHYQNYKGLNRTSAREL